jgi:hypothetical protein
MTITLTREEAQQVLDAFIGMGQRAYDAMSGDAFHECNIAVSRLRARITQPEPEPELEVKFEQVANGIEVGYDFFGGVDIRLGGEFVYVHINYDPRYTHNAARTQLADKIVGLLTGNSAPPQREWQGLTHEEKMEILTRSITAPSRIEVAEALLKEKNSG